MDIEKAKAAARKKASAALDLAEYASGELKAEERAALEKRAHLEPYIETVAAQTGLPAERAVEIAREVERSGEPALIVERIRAEVEAKEIFEELFEKEVARIRTCPVRVKRESGWELCGLPLESIQQALVHHSIHLLHCPDYRTQRATLNDIRELLYPTEIRGVRAALPAEERAALTRDPRIVKRLLHRGDDY